jgi:hypothetical protein
MQDSQPTIIVPIENPSFQWGATGWKFGPSSGITQFNDPNHILGSISVAYAGYGGSFSQVLTATPAQLQEFKPGYTNEGVYVLKFSVANFYPSYPGYYTAEVSFGTQELCETSGWGTKSFTEVTLVCPGPGYLVVDKALPNGGPVQGQQKLAISFTASGWTLLFDNISMEFTPQ